jgi:hypothetical protein
LIKSEIQNLNASPDGEDLEEKKLLGSGGYAIAKLTEQEEIKASWSSANIFRKYRKIE